MTIFNWINWNTTFHKLSPSLAARSSFVRRVGCWWPKPICYNVNATCQALSKAIYSRIQATHTVGYVCAILNADSLLLFSFCCCSLRRYLSLVCVNYHGHPRPPPCATVSCQIALFSADSTHSRSVYCLIATAPTSRATPKKDCYESTSTTNGSSSSTKKTWGGKKKLNILRNNFLSWSLQRETAAAKTLQSARFLYRGEERRGKKKE